jgi:hypothetical protein
VLAGLGCWAVGIRFPEKLKKYIFVATPHTGCRACRNSYPLGNGEIFLEVIRLDLIPNHAYPEE